jgi:hypothetical protein
VFRVVAGAWLVGWFWKAPYYASYYLSEIWTHRIHYAGLPNVLEYPAVISIAWLAPAIVGGVALAMPRPWITRATAVVMTLCAFIGCVHVETCNDATFVTSFWTGAWLVWFTANAEHGGATFAAHARRLARCIVALVFLGGVVGKLTGAYVHGDAFYHLYFVQKASWPYTSLREAFSLPTLAAAARWFSRVTIVIELAMVASPLFPERRAVIGGVIVMITFVLVSTLYLVSVMACLIGLLVAVRLLGHVSQSPDRPPRAEA